MLSISVFVLNMPNIAECDFVFIGMAVFIYNNSNEGDY